MGGKVKRIVGTMWGRPADSRAESVDTSGRITYSIYNIKRGMPLTMGDGDSHRRGSHHNGSYPENEKPRAAPMKDKQKKTSQEEAKKRPEKLSRREALVRMAKGAALLGTLGVTAVVTQGQDECYGGYANLYYNYSDSGGGGYNNYYNYSDAFNYYNYSDSYSDMYYNVYDNYNDTYTAYTNSTYYNYSDAFNYYNYSDSYSDMYYNVYDNYNDTYYNY
jgi:hypothetical protein